MDPKSPYAIKTVNAERILAPLMNEFNPYRTHQDCHEFLVLLLDRLHDEMALIHEAHDDESTQEPEQKKDSEAEWSEVGLGN